MEFDNLKRAFDSLKSITFFQRLFSWGKIKSQLIDANGDLQRLFSIIENVTSENSKLGTSAEIEKASSKNLLETNNRLSTEIQVIKQSNSSLNKQYEDSLKEIATLKESNNSFLKRGTELSNELATARQKLENAEVNLQKVRNQITQL